MLRVAIILLGVVVGAILGVCGFLVWMQVRFWIAFNPGVLFSIYEIGFIWYVYLPLSAVGGGYVAAWLTREWGH